MGSFGHVSIPQHAFRVAHVHLMTYRGDFGTRVDHSTCSPRGSCAFDDKVQGVVAFPPIGCDDGRVAFRKCIKSSGITYLNGLTGILKPSFRRFTGKTVIDNIVAPPTSCSCTVTPSLKRHDKSAQQE
nr:uncharacterized protein LOC109177157 [Ipomoea trifida]